MRTEPTFAPSLRRGSLSNPRISYIFILSKREGDQRQALNNIGTNFELKDEEVDLLIKSAGEVLRGSPDFQTFLERTNGMVKQP